MNYRRKEDRLVILLCNGTNLCTLYNCTVHMYCGFRVCTVNMYCGLTVCRQLNEL